MVDPLGAYLVTPLKKILCFHNCRPPPHRYTSENSTQYCPHSLK